jgi:hypothetical protein
VCEADRPDATSHSSGCQVKALHSKHLASPDTFFRNAQGKEYCSRAQREVLGSLRHQRPAVTCFPWHGTAEVAPCAPSTGWGSSAPKKTSHASTHTPCTVSRPLPLRSSSHPTAVSRLLLGATLAQAQPANVDETSWHEGRNKGWVWAARGWWACAVNCSTTGRGGGPSWSRKSSRRITPVSAPCGTRSFGGSCPLARRARVAAVSSRRW